MVCLFVKIFRFDSVVFSICIVDYYKDFVITIIFIFKSFFQQYYKFKIIIQVKFQIINNMLDLVIRIILKPVNITVVIG